MKYFHFLIWWFFLYLLVLWTLVLDYKMIIFVFFVILFFAILSQCLYKKYYKIEKKYYEFFLYPGIFICLIIWWLFLQNGKTHVYTIEYWEKHITFIGMSHIATQKYYSQIWEILNNARIKNSIHVYEWISMNTDKKTYKNNNTYENLEKIFDNNDILTNKYYHPEHKYDAIFRKPWDINIDMSFEQINMLLQQNTASENSQVVKQSDTQVATFQQPKIIQKWKYSYLNRVDIFFLRSYYNIGLFIESIKPRDKLWEVLVYKRNEHLFQEIQKLSQNNIVITYWNGHVNDFLYLVRKKYPQAHIQLIDTLDPYRY